MVRFSRRDPWRQFPQDQRLNDGNLKCSNQIWLLRQGEIRTAKSHSEADRDFPHELYRLPR